MRHLIALSLFASVALVAAPQDFSGRQGGRGGMPPSAIATALDTNRDATISGAEMDAAPASLKTLDKNGDGRLTFDELLPAFGRGGEGPRGREGRGGEGREGRGGAGEPGETPTTSPDELASLLMAFDRNGDGQLEKTEVPERMQGIFDRADVNKDGKVNADEIRKSAASASQPNSMGGRGRGEGREGFGGEGRGRGGPGGFDRLLTALDTDKDNAVSAAEIAAAPTSLRTLDTNKDGQLTPEEYGTPGRGGRGGDARKETH